MPEAEQPAGGYGACPGTPAARGRPWSCGRAAGGRRGNSSGAGGTAGRTGAGGGGRTGSWRGRVISLPGGFLVGPSSTRSRPRGRARRTPCTGRTAPIDRVTLGACPGCCHGWKILVYPRCEFSGSGLAGSLHEGCSRRSVSAGGRRVIQSLSSAHGAGGVLIDTTGMLAVLVCRLGHCRRPDRGPAPRPHPAARGPLRRAGPAPLWATPPALARASSVAGKTGAQRAHEGIQPILVLGVKGQVH